MDNIVLPVNDAPRDILRYGFNSLEYAAKQKHPVAVIQVLNK